MKLQPQGERLLVKRFETKNMSKGGIILTSEAQEPPSEGIILEVGTVNTHLKKDNQILFSKYAGTPVGEDSADMLIMEYKDVLAVVNG